MSKLGRSEVIANTNIEILASATRTATTGIDVENTYNTGAAFIIDITDGGTNQAETATAVATITIDGNINAILTSALTVGSPLTTVVAVAAGDNASAVAGKIRAALSNVAAITADYAISGATDKVIITALEEAANDATLNLAITYTPSSGTTNDTTSTNTTAGAFVNQVETATIVGTCTTGGALTVTVTGALVTGSPLSIQVPIVATDTPTQQAVKIRAALNIPAITDNYTVGGATDKVILTTNTPAANDATLNIDVHITTDIGVTADATSTNTTAGVAAVAQVETATAAGAITVEGNLEVIVTGALIVGSPLTLSPTLVQVGVPMDTIASLIRAKLNATAAITDFYTVSGATDKIILTASTAGPNDATLNIDVHNDTSVGYTDAVSSANTTAGAGVYQVETATVVATITVDGFIETALASGLFATINTPVAVAVGDTATDVALKISDALNLNGTITTNYTVAASGADVIVTAKAYAANDAALNLATAWTVSVGTVDDVTSDNTTAGAFVKQVETASYVGNIVDSGLLTIITTGALVTGSPLTQYLQVTAGDTQNQVATAIRSLMNVAAITDNYVISGATNEIILTAKAEAVNDATLNIDYHITTDIGLTDAAASANTTAGTSTLNVTPKIEGYDPISGKYYSILTGAAITTAGTTVLRVHPSLTAAANTIAKDMLPKNYKFTMTHGDALPVVYSVAVNGS